VKLTGADVQSVSAKHMSTGIALKTRWARTRTMPPKSGPMAAHDSRIAHWC